MKIICISGKAQHGKDYTAEYIKSNINKKTVIIHYGDLLKYIAEKYFNWNGKKDKEGRNLLQHLGTDVVRKQEPDFWVDYLINMLKVFSKEWEYVIIPDCRFPNEIDKLKSSGFDIITLRVIRPYYDNGLTKEQKAHISETALDDYQFDYTLINSGNSFYNQFIDNSFLSYI